MSRTAVLRPLLVAAAALAVAAGAAAQTTQGITTATSPQPKGATGGPVGVPPSRETIHQNEGAYLQRGPVNVIEGPTANQINHQPQGEVPPGIVHRERYPTATQSVRESQYDYTENPDNYRNPGETNQRGATVIGGANGVPSVPAMAPGNPLAVNGGSPVNGWLVLWLLPVAGLIGVGAASAVDRNARTGVR